LSKIWQAKVNDLAGDEYRNSVLESIKKWIQNRQTFEIIVDYPDSVPAIDDLKQCLEYTGQHSKLVYHSHIFTAVRKYCGLDDDIKYRRRASMRLDIPKVGPDRFYAEPLKWIRYTVKESRSFHTTPIKTSTLRYARLELLKIHFGESSMQKCEIMLNDLIDSKRTNTNVKNTINQLSQTGAESREHEDEDVNIPEPMDQLLGDYAKRFHEIKTPRKLLWKKNLGTVKLELEFEDRTLQFIVTPVHATIIMKFQEQTSWTSESLAAAIGLPVDTLQRRINFWISKGIVAESSSGGDSSDHLYTLVDSMADGGKTAVNSEEMMADDDAERSVASVEDQLRKEMTVYELT
ncbi:anaphase-promoting complex subunit 2 isoform X1, partial [Tanacetum coccineum]